MSNTNRRRTREHGRSKTTKQMDAEDELMMEYGDKGPIRPNANRTICRLSNRTNDTSIRTLMYKNKRRLIL